MSQAGVASDDVLQAGLPEHPLSRSKFEGRATNAGSKLLAPGGFSRSPCGLSGDVDAFAPSRHQLAHCLPHFVVARRLLFRLDLEVK